MNNTNTGRNFYNNSRSFGNNKKKLRVKSPARFITFLVIVFGLIAGIAGTYIGLNNSVALTADDYKYEYVTVSNGDTLWNIANEYKDSDTSTKKAIYEICKINGIDEPTDLQVGMELSIPKKL